MLSQSPEHHEDTPVAPASPSSEPAEVQPPAFKELLRRFDKEFFREWFIDGPKGILAGRFSRRAAAFMIAASVPGILTGLVLTVPALLFHTPEHQAFYYFAQNLRGDLASALPVLLGVISAAFSFRFPLDA